MPTRVWEQYLTAQDRASLALLPPPIDQFGERAALLLVDVYRGAFGDEPVPLLESIRRWPASCGPAAWAALPHIQTILSAARRAGLLVVHITGQHVSDGGIERWSARGRDLVRGGPPRDTAGDARQRRNYEIMPQVAPIAGEAVIKKVSPSSFCDTPLLAHLHANRIDTVIVVGESTSGCVRATVVDARARGLRVVVAEQCVFDRHEASHAINLFDIHQKYGAVLPVDAVLAWVSAHGPATEPG